MVIAAMNAKHTWRASKTAVMAMLLALAGLGSIASASAENAGEIEVVKSSDGQPHHCADGPEGSWLYTVDISGFIFQGTETYGAGGGYVEADQLSTMTGSLATPGHGAWKIIGERKFLLTYVNLTHYADGNPSGTSKIRQTTKISRTCDFYSGSGDYAYYDLNGALVAGQSGTFTITATRIKVEAPE